MDHMPQHYEHAVAALQLAEDSPYFTKATLSAYTTDAAVSGAGQSKGAGADPSCTSAPAMFLPDNAVAVVAEQKRLAGEDGEGKSEHNDGSYSYLNDQAAVRNSARFAMLQGGWSEVGLVSDV